MSTARTSRAHSRHSSAVSSSSAVRSPSPSPSASPVLLHDEGLRDRRLSWHRPREESDWPERNAELATQEPSVPPAAHPSSRVQFEQPPPFLHDLESATSLASIDFDDDDTERLTPHLSNGTRTPKAYDPTTTFGDRVKRSPTVKHVSQQLRKASVRVANIMAVDNEGMVRLADDETVAEQSLEIGLRGRTLGVFSAHSHVRRAADKLLRQPWTEPAILALIVANVVILAIQSAPSLTEPRIDVGYFQSWEDTALLALFAVFTAEMLARVVVSGFVFDPDTSLRAVWRDLRKRPRATGVHRTASTNAPRWRRFQDVKSDTKARELPFQQAVHHSQALAAQNRPYLRHSWHRIDLLAIVAFWITFFLALSGQEATATRHIYIFRALSVLRAARLLVITSGTTTILHSLKRAGPLLVTVAWFIIFAVALFSIIGVQSFRGSFRRNCILTDPNNASNTINLGQSCGGWLDPVTLSETNYLVESGAAAVISPKGYICPLNQVCQTTDQNQEGNAESFDNIFAALLQVIVIASSNTWSGLMYSAMDTDFFSSSLYFLAAIIVLNFWLINLLVAVVVNTFKDIRAQTKRSAFGAEMDLTWATDSKRQGGLLLRLYNKTQWIWTLLVLADLVAQACKTSQSSGSTINLLKNIELAATIAFDIEILFRIVAHLPDWSAFLHNGRNDFDLFLAVATSIIQIPPINTATVYPWLTVFQLLRWYRVILAFPRMKPLLMTVFGSFAGLFNMVVFLFLMNFLGALMAVQLLRGDIALGDTITFSQVYNSFLGMYQLFSSENWTTVLYAAMDAEFSWQQGWLVAVFLCGWFIFANFIMLQMFVAVINENFAVAEEQKRKQQIEAFIRKTEPESAHVSWVERLNPYRLIKAQHKAVKVGALPPNLLLPLKQTVGVDVGTPQVSQMKDKRLGQVVADDGTKGAMRRLFGFDSKETAIPLRRLRRSVRVEDLDDLEDDRGLTDLLPPLTAGPSADEHLDAIRERRNQQADFIAAHPSYDRSLWIFSQANPLRRFCQACVPPAHGERIFGRPPHPVLSTAVKLLLFLVVVASITVAAVATPLYRKDYYAQHGLERGTWFDLTEVGLGMVFVLEAVVKIVADGFIFAPNAYLLSLWNVLDFGILVTLLVNTTTSLIFIGGLSRITRSLKAFRALRLITLFSRLRDTFHAVLFAGALRILDASVLMILYIIPFAVWGLNIFSGLLFSCNDSDASGKTSCINEYLATPVDSSLAFLAPRVWTNPTIDDSSGNWAFDSFRQAILILFEIVSLEGWIDVMSSVMIITGLDQQPQDGASQWNAIFFLIFNLFGGVIILTLFVSIIIENFSIRSGNALLTTEQRHWVDLGKFIKRQTPSQLPMRKPNSLLRAWCYDRAVDKAGWWARAFTGLYYIHILFLMFEDYSSNIVDDTQLDWIFLVLTFVYAVDLFVRFFGLGFKSFRSNGWNLFDVVVITGSFATTIPALLASSKGVAGNQVNLQLQKLFLVSIALKLVQRVDSLNQLFKTSVASLPAIGNLFLLWATLFIFFAILFMEIFGLTKIGNNAVTRFQNYYSFGNSLLMLSFMSTGEGWNGYMHDYTITTPRCTSSSNYLESDCGSAAWAYALFIAWNIISMYIFLNMFTGVVVESFAYVYQMPGAASLNREEIRAFKTLWSEFDTDRSGYIKRKDFVRFFSRLSGVFEVRIYPVEFGVNNIVRASIPDPVANASGRLLVASGVRRAVDVRRVEAQIDQIDYHEVRRRRHVYARLYNEARISEEPGRGISFTAMLMMLAHYKLIDDEKALLLDDLLIRRAKTERVTDLVNLDRVRGLLRTIYWRRRFLSARDEKRRTLAMQAEGIPAIVLDPTPTTPTHETAPALGTATPHISPDHAVNRPVQSPALSPSTRPSPVLSRHVSNSSMLSSEDAHRRESSQESVLEEPTDVDTTMWGDMMRQAMDDEGDD